MLALGCDHAGFDLKNIIIDYLKKNNLAYKDLGCYNNKPCDYPDYAKLVANAILNNEAELGVLICGTGIGISICANRFENIRAALCSDTFSARAAREHNNANILAMGSRVVGSGLAIDILKTFLDTPFSNDPRHVARINKINN